MSKLADELAQIGLAETLNALNKKIEKLEQRVAELESAQPTPTEKKG